MPLTQELAYKELRLYVKKETLIDRALEISERLPRSRSQEILLNPELNQYLQVLKECAKEKSFLDKQLALSKDINVLGGPSSYSSQNFQKIPDKEMGKINAELNEAFKNDMISSNQASLSTSQPNEFKEKEYSFKRVGGVTRKNRSKNIVLNAENLTLEEEKQLPLESRLAGATSSTQLQNKPLDLPTCKSKFFELKELEEKQNVLKNELRKIEEKQNVLKELEEKQKKLREELEVARKNKGALDQRELQIEKEREKAAALNEKKEEQRKQLEKRLVSYKR